MWYRYAQDQIWDGIIWSGPLGDLLQQYIHPKLITDLGFDKNPNVWAIIVDNEETYNIINNSISSYDADENWIVRGCFIDINSFTPEQKENLQAVGDLINCPDLDSKNGLMIIKQKELDAALLAHEATHANRYQRSFKTDYTTNKEEIEAEINEGILERILDARNEPVSEIREKENTSTYLKLQAGIPLDYLSLRNMLIRYIVMYSNNLQIDKQYLNRLAMQFNIFFKSLYDPQNNDATNSILSRIALALMHGDLDPDELLKDQENILHENLFNAIKNKKMNINNLNLLDYGQEKIYIMFQELISDAYDAIESQDYDLAQRLLNMIDSLYIKAKAYKIKTPSNVSDHAELLDDVLTDRNFVPQQINYNYPEHPQNLYSNLSEPLSYET